MARLPAKKAAQKPAVSKESKITRAVMNEPEIVATTVILSVFDGAKFPDDMKLDYNEIQKTLQKQVKQVQEGDLAGIEGILTTQLQVLNQAFSICMAKGFNSKGFETMLAYTHAALKMQEQTRRTASTLASIKAPRQTAFIKQQVNTAQNQQVINGPVANHTSKNFLPEPEQLQNKLRGREHGMDAGATIETIGIDTPTAAMGEVHRAEDSRGQTQIGAKLL